MTMLAFRSTASDVIEEAVGNSVLERAERAAQQTRVDAATVERLPFDLSALEDEGVLVVVDVRNFGLLDGRLDRQALGITLPRETDLSFRPPRCGLVPDRYRLPILRPAAQVHLALHRFSYKFRLVETVLETPALRYSGQSSTQPTRPAPCGAGVL